MKTILAMLPDAILWFNRVRAGYKMFLRLSKTDKATILKVLAAFDDGTVTPKEWNDAGADMGVFVSPAKKG